MSKHESLEDLVDSVLLGASAPLRLAICQALDQGAKPDDIRHQHGIQADRCTITACAVDAIVAEWERERSPSRPVFPTRRIPT